MFWDLRIKKNKHSRPSSGNVLEQVDGTILKVALLGFHDVAVVTRNFLSVGYFCCAMEMHGNPMSGSNSFCYSSLLTIDCMNLSATKIV